MTKLVYVMVITSELAILSFLSVLHFNYKFTGAMYLKIRKTKELRTSEKVFFSASNNKTFMNLFHFASN